LNLFLSTHLANSLARLRRAPPGVRVWEPCKSLRDAWSPRRAKFDERCRRGNIVEYSLDGHSYFNLFRRAVDNVAQHLDALVQLNPCHNVRKGFSKARGLILISHGEGINPSFSGRPNPFRVRGQTTRADCAGMKSQVSALATLLHV